MRLRVRGATGTNASGKVKKLAAHRGGAVWLKSSVNLFQSFKDRTAIVCNNPKMENTVCLQSFCPDRNFFVLF